MAQLTIAQLREKEIDRLVSFHSDIPTEEDYATARRLMNSFYRLAALDGRNAELSNDDRTCNSSSTKRSEERAFNWYKRLDREFFRVYGLRICYCGIYPSIGIFLEHGAFSEKIQRYFYD